MMPVRVSACVQAFATLLVLLGLSAAPEAGAQSAPAPIRKIDSSPLFAGLADRWSGAMDTFCVPGLAVGIVKDGEIYAQVWGMRDPMSGLPVTLDTMFYIASVTKTFNAAAVLTMDAEGLLSLDDPVKKHLPRFALSDASLTESVTIRDLLCFRHGIDCGHATTLDAFTGEITEDRYWRWMPSADIANQPDYTNTHFTLIGRVMESAADVPWQQYLRERILKPAGLSRTTCFMSEVDADPDAAIGSFRSRSLGPWTRVEQRKTDRTMHAAGGMALSVSDGARWLQLLLGDGQLDGRRIFPSGLTTSMNEMHAKLAEPGRGARINEGFGYAWSVGTVGGKRFCSRGGDYPGFAAGCVLFPDDNAGFIILMNAGDLAAGLREVITQDLTKCLTGVEPPADLLSMMTARMTKARKTGDWSGMPPPPQPPRHLPSASLSRPIGLYTGWFHHADVGTLRITQEVDGLQIAVGDSVVDVAPAPGEKDRFIIDPVGAPEERIGRFVINHNGTIDRVHMDYEDFGTVEFVR